MVTKGQTNKKGQAKPSPRTDNLLEALRDIGDATASSVKKDVVQGVPESFMRQLLGIEKPPVKASGDIAAGGSIEIDEILKQEKEENKVLRQRLAQEKRLRDEEQVLFAKKSQELKVELHALVHEVQELARTTQGLSQEVEVATMQAPVNPGIYHVIFFEKLREFIASFRKKIENASLWLQAYNQRAAKKRTFWGQVGMSGSKRLLSPEDYLQRSAG